MSAKCEFLCFGYFMTIEPHAEQSSSMAMAENKAWPAMTLKYQYSKPLHSAVLLHKKRLCRPILAHPKCEYDERLQQRPSQMTPNYAERWIITLSGEQIHSLAMSLPTCCLFSTHCFILNKVHRSEMCGTCHWLKKLCSVSFLSILRLPSFASVTYGCVVTACIHCIYM